MTLHRPSRLAALAGLAAALALGASTLSAQTAKPSRTWRLYVSGFGAFVGHAEFPNAYNELAGQLWVMIDENRGWGLVLDKADPGYGFTIGITSWPDLGAPGRGRGMRIRGYAELTYMPGFSFPDRQEYDWRYHAGPQGGGWIDEVVTFAQTARKSRYMGLNVGAVYLPFPKVPVGLDAFAGLWSSRLEFTSGTVAYYESRVSIQPVRDLLQADYTGRGQFSNSGFGFVLGAGLKIYPARFVSLDLKFTGNLVTSRKEATNYYYVESGETVMKSIAGFGNVTSVGLTVYF